MVRYPIKDQVAIVGIGSTGFTRGSDRSTLSLAVEAGISALRDAGLTAADVDGLVATREPAAPRTIDVAQAMGLTQVNHHASPSPLIVFSLLDAMHAVFSGLCETVLLMTPVYQLPWASRSARNDVFRRRFGGGGVAPAPEALDGAAAYAAWAGRYLHEYDVDREVFGRIAINSRSNAATNPLAAMRQGMDFDDYYAARMIREPLSMLDMDVPVDGADAFVLTTADRAKTLPHPPVLIHAATAGMLGLDNGEDQLPSLRRHGQHVVVESLKARSDIWIDDVDLFYPYEGFTNIAVGWIENCGWCPPGGATNFLRDHWDAENNRIVIDGRVGVNTHGGSLSEGGTRGTGHMREAVTQLRGQAGDRQVPGAQAALVTPGGFFFNSQGAILRTA